MYQLITNGNEAAASDWHGNCWIFLIKIELEMSGNFIDLGVGLNPFALFRHPIPPSNP